jgi:hypothetical protein
LTSTTRENWYEMDPTSALPNKSEDRTFCMNCILGASATCTTVGSQWPVDLLQGTRTGAFPFWAEFEVYHEVVRVTHPKPMHVLYE